MSYISLQTASVLERLFGYATIDDSESVPIRQWLSSKLERRLPLSIRLRYN
jgi:hypothetical protein